MLLEITPNTDCILAKRMRHERGSAGETLKSPKSPYVFVLGSHSEHSESQTHASSPPRSFFDRAKVGSREAIQ